jgi:hypothetical protein
LMLPGMHKSNEGGRKDECAGKEHEGKRLIRMNCFSPSCHQHTLISSQYAHMHTDNKDRTQILTRTFRCAIFQELALFDSAAEMVEITEGKPLHLERLSSRWNGTAQSLSATNTEGRRVAEGGRHKVIGNESKRVVYIARGIKVGSAKQLASTHMKACSH